MNNPVTKDEIVDDILTAFRRGPNGIGAELATLARVPVRIAVHFFQYLETYEQLENADAEELDYIVNTVRSGMDDYFACAQHYRVAVDSSAVPRWAMHLTYESLRNEYIASYGTMRTYNVPFKVRFEALLRLVELQLQFLAANFRVNPTS